MSMSRSVGQGVCMEDGRSHFQALRSTLHHVGSLVCRQSPRLARHTLQDSTPATSTSIVVPALRLLLITLFVYTPVYRGQPLWDDNDLIFKNPAVGASDGLFTIWCTTESADYFPLTSTLYWIEWRLWGDNVVGYHLVNVLLHAASALMTWRVLTRLKIPGAYLAAVLLAIHPVGVASVGWMAESKNALSLLGYATAIWAYLRFESERRVRWYLASLAFFLLAMLAKSSVVMLPVVLLLFAWWQRQRITWQDVRQTVPFFGIAFLLGLVTVYFQHHNAIQGGNPRPEGPLVRLATTGWVVWFYLFKDLVPTHLAMIYPRWVVRATDVADWFPLASLLMVFGVAWIRRDSWGRPLLMALSYFVIVLFPVLGLIKMAFHGHSLVSDHLQYLAIIAPMTLIAAGLTRALAKVPSSNGPLTARGAWGVVVAVVLTLSLLTWRQADRFSSPRKLWGHSLELNDQSFAAHLNYGAAVGVEGEKDNSLRHLAIGLRLRPNVPRYRRHVESFIGRMGWRMPEEDRLHASP